MNDYKIERLSKELLQTNLQVLIGLAKNNIEGEYWNEDNFLIDLKGKWELSFLVKEDFGKIVAFLIASEKEASVHIHKFVVDFSFQRLGVGSLMLDHLKKTVLFPITLKVNIDNTKAIRFYASKGFTIVDQQNDLLTMNCN